MTDAALIWQAASITIFAYTAAIALARRETVPAARAVGLALTGILLTALSTLLAADGVARQWIVPPVLLLLAYWSTGALFTTPMPDAEARLLALDRLAGVERWGLPRAVVEVLEAAYLGVYPLIPIALWLYLRLVDGGGSDRFWTVVLVTDFLCFATLPWFQTRPPRALERPAIVSPTLGSSSVRVLNQQIVGTASVQANTFPSGHAAEAFVVALLVCSGAPAWICLAMFLAAFAVSAGAVVGRYHYLLDVLTGWVVALAVWWSLA